MKELRKLFCIETKAMLMAEGKAFLEDVAAEATAAKFCFSGELVVNSR
jgi:hypothetical protein